MNEIGNAEKQEVGRWANNRVENSHQPFRGRERAMLRCRQRKSLQKFASVHASFRNHFNKIVTSPTEKASRIRQSSLSQTVTAVRTCAIFRLSGEWSLNLANYCYQMVRIRWRFVASIQLQSDSLMKIAILAGAAFLSLALGASAQAKTFDFSFTSSGGDVGAGTFTTGSTGSPFTVTGISGTIDGSAITGLSSYAGSDQLLYVGTSSYFDVPGVSFSGANSISYNLTDFPDGSNRITNSVYDPPGVGTPEPYALTSLSISAVPEPSVWIMMLGGIAMMGAALRFGRRRTAVALAA